MSHVPVVPSTILPIIREITHIKKCQKMYNFIIKSAMFKRSIITTYDAVPVLDEK
jgi:hypothetical protein